MNRYHYKFPIGTLCIEEENQCITGLYRDDNIEGEEQETELLKKAHQQLKEYFSGKRKTFDLPIHLEGTEFQKKVWEALQTIPYGETYLWRNCRADRNPKASGSRWSKS